jgi:transcriptional regulator with XRE-family HTH domain
MSIFSKRLSAARKFRRLSQIDLARKTRLKQSAISQFETGRRAPSFHNLLRLADALDVTADYLMGRSDFTEKQPLSSKDMKFLRRVVSNLVHNKNARYPLRDRATSESLINLQSLFS